MTNMIGQTYRWKRVRWFVPALWAMVALSVWGSAWAQEMPVVEIGERPIMRTPGGAILIPMAGLDGLIAYDGWPAAPAEDIDSFAFYRHVDLSDLDDAGVHPPAAGPAWPGNEPRLALDDDRGPLIVPEPTAVLFLAIGAVLLAMKRTGARGAHSRPA